MVTNDVDGDRSSCLEGFGGSGFEPLLLLCSCLLRGRVVDSDYWRAEPVDYVELRFSGLYGEVSA